MGFIPERLLMIMMMMMMLMISKCNNLPLESCNALVVGIHHGCVFICLLFYLIIIYNICIRHST